jgi:hypothetical protein
MNLFVWVLNLLSIHPVKFAYNWRTYFFYRDFPKLIVDWVLKVAPRKTRVKLVEAEPVGYCTYVLALAVHIRL